MKTNLPIKVILPLVCFLLFLPMLLQARTTRTVASVTTAVTLSGELDYHISGTTPISGNGAIDIQDEETWIIFEKVIPSAVINNYLGKITINGVACAINNNVMVSVYKEGAILIPHGTNYFPLTVYTGRDFTGESKNDFAVFTYYKSLGTFDNAIQSFKLKRGYMVTFANNAGGTGYSRCYIADSEDLIVPQLPGELRGNISFIRIFRWRWPSKKGYAGGDGTALDILNSTWHCDWNIGGDGGTDYEYVPHRHHIGWPGYDGINAKTNVTHLLGDNEPDNTNDSRENAHTVDEVLAQWENMYGSGLRVGSPACTNANSWLYSFVDSCDARGYRLDFVALHCYWYMDAASWRSNLQNIYNRVKRPLWITEWNYGANWTGWPGDDADNPTANDYQLHLKKIREIVAVLEELPFVERYAFYNWVKEARKFYKDGYVLTPSGSYYASTTPDYFFNRNYEVVPKAVYKNIGKLTSVFTPAKSTVKLSWSDNNRELTDSTIVARKVNDGDYETIATIYNGTQNNYSYTDTLASGAANYTYRVTACCADGRERKSGEAYVSISGTEGTTDFQYGRLEVSSTDYNYNYFCTPFDDDDLPAVIFGPSTNNNTNVAPCPHVYQIKANYFQFRYTPWIQSEYQTLSASESSSYLAVKKGNGTFGNMVYECAQIGEKVGRDTLQVTFNQPFADGVKPIVLIGLYTTHTSHPFMWKIWDITNTGFKIRLVREAGITASTFLKEYVTYFAITPGKGNMPDGKQISAGRGETPVGKILRTVKFGDNLPNPHLFAEPQSALDNMASILRYTTLCDSSFRIRRQVDTSVSGTSRNDTIGWVVISDNPNSIDTPEAAVSSSLTITATGSKGIYEIKDGSATEVTVYSITGIKVCSLPMQDGSLRLDLSGEAPGTYILRTDNRHCKLIMRR